MSELLEVTNVTVTFGGVTAISGASLSAAAGEIHGLIGPNGAGKSTLFNVVCGLVRPRTGSVRFDSRDITSLSTHRRARLGMARTFQQLEHFGVLSVHDNVLTAAEIRRSWAHDRSHCRDETRAVLERTGLLDVADERADRLPTGLARLLDLARALAAKPKMLLLDEPAAGLNEHETRTLGTLLSDIATSGVGIVLVEHDMDLVMQICAVVTVLDLGRVLLTAPPAIVRQDPAVLSAYLGSTTTAAAT